MLYEPFAGEIDPSDTAPLAVHADGAPTNKADGVFTINWGSQTAEGPTIQKKLVFTCVKKSDLTDGTLEQLFDYFAWAMNALLEGRYPMLDWKGRKFKDAGRVIKTRGWNCACNQVRGDWDFSQKV